MRKNSTLSGLGKVMREKGLIAAEFDPASDGEEHFMDVEKREHKALEVSTRFLLDFFSRKRDSL